MQTNRIALVFALGVVGIALLVLGGVAISHVTHPAPTEQRVAP